MTGPLWTTPLKSPPKYRLTEPSRLTLGRICQEYPGYIASWDLDHRQAVKSVASLQKLGLVIFLDCHIRATFDGMATWKNDQGRPPCHFVSRRPA